VKCPKCNYLGFETGDRCKNCGYDFSLIPSPSEPDNIDLDLTLRTSDDNRPVSVRSDDEFDGALGASRPSIDIAALARPVPAPSTARPERTDSKLPLFASAFDAAGDAPLIRLPATPRPPLSVRRTPNTPRPRPVPKPSRPITEAPSLEFGDEPAAAPSGESLAEVRARTAARLAVPPQPAHAEASGSGSRLAAAAVDHLLLVAIDLSVIYFTLRMTGLPMAQWTVLPPAPLVAFILLVKLSYFCAFTAVGGQTIGKMAARIRVVTTEDASVDGARALKRTLAGAASAALLGLGYLPALIGSDRLALHDRVTHTRVIVLPPL
jgi:uncharacterized RDD family membrane protein YckC